MMIKAKIKKFNSKLSVKKKVLLYVSCLAIAAVPLELVYNSKSVDAVTCSTVAECQQQKELYQAEAAKLSDQANTLQRMIGELEYQAKILQTQIDMSQAQYNDLQQQITDTEQKIKDNQDALGTIIADMYVSDDITPLEMLAGSGTIGEYLDKQEYRSSISSQLSSTIMSIKNLKKDLENKKNEVELVIISQRNAMSELDRKNQEQQDLLAKTNGNETAYQQLAAEADEATNRILAAQQAWNSSVIGTYSDYSQIWNDTNCKMGSQYNPDTPGYYSWGGSNGDGGDGHSYGCRQCVSYAMWRVFKATGVYYENWGDPVHLSYSALGVFETSSIPRANSLGIMSAEVAQNDGQGHVVWVEKVNDDGTLEVSQYNANIKDQNGNYIGYGQYSKVKISANRFYEYIYIN